MNVSLGGEILLFIRIFSVNRDAHWVEVTPSKLRQYPPTVRRTRQVSSLCGLISATIRP